MNNEIIRVGQTEIKSLLEAAHTNRSLLAVAAVVFMLMLVGCPIHCSGGELVLQILHEFTNGTNAPAFPWELVQSSDGDFYASSSNGGTYNRGTIFRLTQDGSVNTLVSFNGDNGEYPEEGLIEGADGLLYGTTYQRGGTVSGTIFRITPGGDFTNLHYFECFQGEGEGPICRLLQIPSGELYGTTSHGGASGCSGVSAGTIFKITMGDAFMGRPPPRAHPARSICAVHFLLAKTVNFGHLVSRHSTPVSMCNQKPVFTPFWLLIAALSLALVTPHASAADAAKSASERSVANATPPELPARITTLDGKTYEKVILEKVNPDGLLVRFTPVEGGSGTAKLKFRNLPPELRERYGYDPARAADYEVAQAQGEAAWLAESAVWAQQRRAAQAEQAAWEREMRAEELRAAAEAEQAGEAARYAQEEPGYYYPGWWGSGFYDSFHHHHRVGGKFHHGNQMFRPHMGITSSPISPHIGPMRPNIAPMRPNIAPMRPNIAPMRPNIAPMRPNIAPMRPNIAPMRPSGK